VSTWLAGAYTDDMDGESLGIAVLVSRVDGSLENRGFAVRTPSPSYLLRDGNTVYAAAEGTGRVEAFAVENSRLAHRGGATSGGRWPCHLALYDGTLVAANYGDGRLGVLSSSPLGLVATLAGEGQGPDPRQDGPHAHSTARVGDLVLSADLGADLIAVHRLQAGNLARVGGLALPPATGPRDILVHPSGRIFVLGELASVVVELQLVEGELSVVAVAGIPDAAEADQAAALALSVDGRFVFTALRGSNRVATFDLSSGLTPLGSATCGGAWPRHIAVDGACLHVANQLSSTVTTLAIAADGSLTPVGDAEPVASPTFLLGVSDLAVEPSELVK
jgi:6-phosphogluconolactonase (cycloisomerase 2 family)